MNCVVIQVDRRAEDAQPHVLSEISSSVFSSSSRNRAKEKTADGILNALRKGQKIKTAVSPLIRAVERKYRHF